MPLFRCVKDTYEPSRARRFKPGMEEVFQPGEFVDPKKWRQLKDPESEFVDEPAPAAAAVEHLVREDEHPDLADVELGNKTVVQLRKEAAIRGITIPRDITKKEDIITLLGQDAGSEAA